MMDFDFEGYHADMIEEEKRIRRQTETRRARCYFLLQCGGTSVKEVAELFGCSTSAVRRSLFVEVRQLSERVEFAALKKKHGASMSWRYMTTIDRFGWHNRVLTALREKWRLEDRKA